MAKKKTKVFRAIREEKDESLWEWTDGIIDDPSVPCFRNIKKKIQHYSASCGDTNYNIGDIVQLNADLTYYWVGIILGFQTDYAKRGAGEIQKQVLVHWFCRKKDVMNGIHSRLDAGDVLSFNVSLVNVRLKYTLLRNMTALIFRLFLDPLKSFLRRVNTRPLERKS
jgi:hypothetical protein